MAVKFDLVNTVWNKFLAAVRDGVNASNGLKEEGRVNAKNNELNLLKGSREQMWSGRYNPAVKPTVVAGTNNVTNISLTVPPGRKIILTSLTLSIGGSGIVRFRKTLDTGSWYTYLGKSQVTDIYFTNQFELVAGSGGAAQTFTFPKGVLLPENSITSLDYASDDTTGRWCAYTATGYDVSSDGSHDAKYLIEVKGDSTTWDKMGRDSLNRVYLGKWLWPQQLKALLRKDGIDVDLVNNGFGGAKAQDIFYASETGTLRTDYDLLIISVGHNDAVTSNLTTEAKYKEALMIHIHDRNLRRPGKYVLFLASSTSDASDRTSLPTYRQWAKDVATDPTYGGVSRNVLFYDQSRAYTLAANATTDVNFAHDERFAGGRLHPSGLGHTLIASNTNADPDNGIASGEQSGVYGVIKKYKSQIFI